LSLNVKRNPEFGKVGEMVSLLLMRVIGPGIFRRGPYSTGVHN
jgi:hypothetical protein